jgi:hypothetical protein
LTSIKSSLALAINPIALPNSVISRGSSERPFAADSRKRCAASAITDRRSREIGKRGEVVYNPLNSQWKVKD